MRLAMTSAYKKDQLADVSLSVGGQGDIGADAGRVDSGMNLLTYSEKEQKQGR